MPTFSNTVRFDAFHGPPVCTPHYLSEPMRLSGPPDGGTLVVPISNCHPLNSCCCVILIYDLQWLMHSEVLFAIIIPVWEAEVTAAVSYRCLAGL